MKSVATIATAITGAAAVFAIGVKIVKWFMALKSQIDTIADHEGENYKSILRITIMSPDMPLSERLKAGEKYVNLGGNGEVKTKYHALQKQYEDNEVMHGEHAI